MKLRRFLTLLEVIFIAHLTLHLEAMAHRFLHHLLTGKVKGLLTAAHGSQAEELLCLHSLIDSLKVMSDVIGEKVLEGEWCFHVFQRQF